MLNSEMFSVIFRTNVFAAQKVLHRAAAPPQKCWISALVRSSDVGGGSLQPRRASPGSLPSKGEDVGLTQSPAVLGSMTTELHQRIQAPAAGLLIRKQHFHSSAVRLKKRPKPEPPPRELDLLRYDMKDLGKSPKPALYLGLAGLVPFVSPPLIMAVTEFYFPELAYAQIAYGAAIVSFLGGARWGFALPESSPAKPDWMNLGNSVIPSLFAWVAMLMCDNVIPAATMVIMGLGISLHYDLALLPTYPSWFKALRAILTGVAFFSLVATLAMDGLFPEKKITFLQ